MHPAAKTVCPYSKGNLRRLALPPIMPTILIVDDEAPIREMLRFSLRNKGFSCIEAADASEAIHEIKKADVDLILLDLMLPGQSGFDFAEDLKADPHTQDLPIIMLTAREGDGDKIKGLNLGADDYVTKPFSPNELVARINAVLRRTSSLASDQRILEVAGLKLDPTTHRFWAKNEAVAVSKTEFNLLYFFMSHPEIAFNRDQLLDNVWDANVYVGTRTVDVHIRRLRKALEPSSLDHLIQTVQGVGYRLSAG